MGLLRQSSLLGLDIGSHSIKLVEVKRTREGSVITCAKAVPIKREQEDDTGEYVADIAIAEALRTLLSKSKLRSKRVVASVSSALEEQVTILPTFFIPDLVPDIPKEAIKASVMTEAEVQARIPFPADVAVVDCNVLEEATVEGQKGLEVFFIAVHRDVIDSRVQLLRSVGLIPVAIDVDFLALARLLAFTNQIPDDGDIAIIDIGASKTSIGFYLHGKLHIYPHVSVAGDYLTDRVSQQLSLSRGVAEEHKKNIGLGAQNTEFDNSEDSEPESSLRSPTVGVLLREESSSAEISEIIREGLEDLQGLCSQLQSRFDFYEADFPDFKPSKIFSAGGTSQLPGLDKLLASHLSISVEKVGYLEEAANEETQDPTLESTELINSRTSLRLDTKGDVDEIEGNELLFATAVGLALKGDVGAIRRVTPTQMSGEG